MSLSKEMHTMRAMAWCRAKGELEAMLNTYWGEGEDGDKYDKASTAIKDFIGHVEAEGLQE